MGIPEKLRPFAPRTARWIIAIGLGGIVLYIALRGFEAFYYESLGTLIVSPIIYLRLMPEEAARLVRAIFVRHGWTTWVVCAVPITMLVSAAIAGTVAFWKRSALLAAGSIGLAWMVFGVYHLLRPMGITFVN